MLWQRRAYVVMIAKLYHKSSLLIQKRLKGFIVWKEYKEIFHRKIIDGMMAHFRVIRIALHTNSQIIIRHQWRLYKRRKAIKAEKKKKKDEALKAKKGKKFGSRAKPAAATAVVAATTIAATPQKPPQPSAN
jgi:hypothetical protein